MRNPSAVPAARPASFTSYKSGHNRSSPDDAGRLPRGGRLHFQAAESADALSRTQAFAPALGVSESQAVGACTLVRRGSHPNVFVTDPSWPERTQRVRAGRRAPRG